ncbi:glycoside hydrolase domain-containing protein [Halalkalibacter sp. APA_J-10(15)]|uniref:glycoside hydrolase domain-containing protein n=1 Tax=Halalkalibacter sp. APA_J-10(15) TaxID=2933805 RepID=UPI001FF37AF3|nr:glycoside hydrolase domain-containing protein [Halalkalibacter sp. APA_J-10(15)]MCK0472322.1 DUF1906 domain-containing protein [Halalkalibacter sp. APA_J-10(15)]
MRCTYRFLPYVLSLVLIFITAFTFYMYGSADTNPVTASDDTQESNGEESDLRNTITNEINTEAGNVDNSIINEVNVSNGEINNSVENTINSKNGDIGNHIENHMSGDDATVDNQVENNITNGSNNTITNHITNNVEVNVDVHVKNNLVNNVEGKGDDGESGTDENGNGDEAGREEENGDGNGNGEASNGETPDTVWGVDSASLTTEDMLSCVRENFGDPKVWARYLGDKDGVSYGLTHEEVEFLHENDIDIMVIWNHFTDATGYEKGQSEATAAIEMAREFDIPEGVAIFANVEPIYPIDADFLLGWYDVMEESEYESGVYGIFHPDRELYTAYETAAEENTSLLENNYVWTSSPNIGITTEENAPEYDPEAPEGSLIAGWQYGIDAQTCNIDTNHFDSNVFDALWD